MKIVIAEPLAETAIATFRAVPGWNVVVTNPKEYLPELADADALVVRSAVKVNADVLSKAPALKVIGRAGVGVDNVDMDAATAAGVIVMNTPGGNAVSVAEHTLAFMLSLARSVPQASASTKGGKWEKKKFLGNELRGKTLGVVGLGAIGREVVLRARGFDMRIIASDPFVSSQLAEDLGVELVDLNKLFTSSDYISLHVGVTNETRNMVNATTLAKMKDGVRIVNCARGELIDAAALADALTSGKVAGAALDVFAVEPVPAEEPLLQFPNVLATPHIGGSTEEAQEIVGIRIAEQMVEYLSHGVAINAVNMPALSPDQYKTVGPWLNVAERLGMFASFISEGNPKSVRFTFGGRIAETNTHLIRNSGMAGVLNRSLAQKANFVNAMPIAVERGLAVDERHEPRGGHFDSLRIDLETDCGVTSVEGAIILGQARLVQVDGIACEASLAGKLIVMRNKDVPGVIGHVGTVLGANSVNIANFSLGRKATGSDVIAISVVEVDSDVPEAALTGLKSHPAILSAIPVDLPAAG